MLPLNQGINYLPIHSSVREALQKRSEVIDRSYNEYGNPTGDERLKTKIAERFGVDGGTHKIILTNGSIESIYMILQSSFSTHKTFIDCVPSWPWPRMFADKFGYQIKPCLSRLTPDFVRANPKSVVNVIKGQNPLGYIYSNAELIHIAIAAKTVDSIVLHDMSHYDFFRYPYPNLLEYNTSNYATFSFSKANGLAALRVGGMICHKNNVAFDMLSPSRLGINTLAETAAMASITSIDDWKPSMIDTIENNKEKIRRRNWKVGFGEDSVHRLSISLPKYISSTVFTEEMKKRGVLVCDLAVRTGEVFGKRDERFNMIGVTVAIENDWLETFIDRFEETYETLE